jgi:hypothetical protein
MRLRTLAITSIALLTGWTTAAPQAFAGGDTAERRADASDVVATGLTDPFGLTSTGRHLVVTEAGGGRVLSIDRRSGAVRTVVDGLGPYAAASAVRIGDRYFIITGGGGPGGPPGAVPAASVLVAGDGEAPVQFADLEAFELANNPDGQTQFGPDGAPLDALSNPFAVAADRSGKGLLLVADGGANDVLRIHRDGRVSTFFVPPTVNTGACEGLPNNDDSTVGCDAVPTGVATGPDGRVYISALTAEVPGEGRVYVVGGRSGRLIRVIKGFTAPTGVAVSSRGSVFVSELLEGAPAAEPPPDFDPSAVGQIVKVDRQGHRSTAQVTMPIGVVMADGKLWSTAWSVAGLFLGATGLGEVTRVRWSLFQRAGARSRGTLRGHTGLGERLRLRPLR